MRRLHLLFIPFAGVTILAYSVGNIRGHSLAESELTAQLSLLQHSSEETRSVCANRPSVVTVQETADWTRDAGSRDSPAAEKQCVGSDDGIANVANAALTHSDGFAEAERAVDDAISRGTWTQEDARALRRATVTPPERSELTRRVIVKINNSEVHVAFRGPAF